MLGHDSEFGLMKDGQIVSALDALVECENKHGKLFPDNMNAEIAITPCTTIKQFHTHTEELLGLARDMGFDLIMEPVVKYPDECLKHEMAKVSGCNPDMSAYRMTNNEAPDFADMDGTRSCGAHIHLSAPDLDPFEWTKWMDAVVTLPLLFKEKPTDRRQLYGGAGCLRVKEYGAEYRVLSNVWLDDPALREFVWEGAHKAAELAKKESFKNIVDWTQIPTAIDTHNLKLAQVVIDRLYIYGINTI